MVSPSASAARRIWAAVLLPLLCQVDSAHGDDGGKASPVARFDGIVESTSGGFKFPDGTVLDSAAGSYANVIVVATSGGHFDSVQAALDSVTDATATNRYVVRVAPGTYLEQVTMKPFVDIEGAGESATSITFTGFSSEDAGTLTGADDAELRFLTVQNTGGTAHAIAILNDGTSPRITHVTAGAQGGTFNTAIRNSGGAAPQLTHVRALAASGEEARGIVSDASQPKLTNVEARATFASAWNVAIDSFFGSTITMNGVVAAASLGNQVVGIHAFQSSIEGRDVSAQAIGAANQSLALANIGSSISIDGGTFLAQGGEAFGLANWTYLTSPSSALLRGVNLVASGTVDAIALDCNGATASVHHSTLESEGGPSPVAIDAGGTSTIQVAHSQAIGGVVGAPSAITCVGAYDENLAPLDADCN